MSTGASDGPGSPAPRPSVAEAQGPAVGATAAQPRLPDGMKELLGGLGGVAVAVITLLAVFNAVNWSSGQTALATAEAAAVVAFLSACVAHLWHGTKKEPVALGGTFTAFVTATLALMSGFDVWTLTQAQVSALVGLVTALIAVGTALFARSQVTAQPKTG
jgi:hypothetical protein